MTIATETTHRYYTAESISTMLGGHKVSNGYIARCPAHDDKSPSLSIRDGNIRTVLKCFAGCPEEAICSALGGITKGNLFPEPLGNLAPQGDGKMQTDQVCETWEGKYAAPIAQDNPVLLGILLSEMSYNARILEAPGAQQVLREIGTDHVKRLYIDQHIRRVRLEPRDVWRAVGAEEAIALHEPMQARPWPTIDQRAFYGLAGDIVRVIAPHTEADDLAILAQLLVKFGNLIGRKPYFRVEADSHHMNLFGCLVGPTAKGRKGTSEGHARNIFHAVDSHWVDNRIFSGLSSGEGLIWEVRDEITRHEPIKKQGRVIDYQDVIVDPGVNDKRLLVIEPEFARVLRVLYRDGNTLSATIRQAWDSGHLRTMTKNSPAKATGTHISIIGHITAEELQRHLTETESANGFANRFLWLCVRRSKVLPEGGMLHGVDLRPTVQCLKEAVAFASNTGELQRDEDARALWREVYPDLSEGKPGLLGATCARAEAQVLRLSCIYALLDKSSMIQRAHLEAALALWHYAEASAAYIFSDTLGDPVADEIVQLLRARPEGMTRTEIYNGFGRHRKSDEISRALGRLQRQHLVQCQKKDTRGRPSEVWVATEVSSAETVQKAQKAQKVAGQEELNAHNTLNAHSHVEQKPDETDRVKNEEGGIWRREV